MFRSLLPAQVARPFNSLVILGSVFIINLLSNPLQAQFLPRYDDVRVKQMSYQSTDGEAGLTIFFYGRDQVLRSGLWMLEDQSRHSRNYHLYDSSGRQIEKYRELSDGMTSTQQYQYDEDGNLIIERFKRSDGVTGIARYHWDKSGRLLAADCERYRGWLSARIDYSYDDAGQLLRQGIISKDERTIGQISYVYDATGHLIEETWSFGEWSQSFGYEYEPIPRQVYSFSNPLFMMNPRFIVSTEEYDFNGESGGPSHYTYDAAGKLTTKVFERSDGLKTVTSFEYDQNGSLKSSHRDYADGASVDFLYTYDQALRLIEKTFERSDGVKGFERYTYDRLGRLETAVYRNMDFWLNGTITFDHDSWGHLTGGHFAGEDGFDAELDIQTDADGNVVRVYWSFTFGKSQTYQLGYRPITVRDP